MLENVIASYFDRKHCVLLGSGTTALYVIYKALELPKNAKVLFPNITCETALNSAIYAELSPVFCDIDLQTFNMDVEKAFHLCNENEVRVIVATHIFGNILDIPTLKERVKDRDIFILEDAAQSFGGELSGIKTGKMGDASIISFGKGKIIDCGGGGAILTDSDELYEKCLKVSRELKQNHFSRLELRNEFMKELFLLNKVAQDEKEFIRLRNELKVKHKDAYLFNIEKTMVNDISNSFKHLEEILRQRKEKGSALYKYLIQNHSKQFFFPDVRGAPVFWRVSLLVERNRDEVYNRLTRNKIKLSRFFKPLHLDYHLSKQDFPNSCYFYDRVLNFKLDCSENVSQSTFEIITNTIRENEN